MPRSKVIRIDEEVWSELQKLAIPLEDTPNSVLRRVFGLPAEVGEVGGLDPRIEKLLELVRESVGETPQIYLDNRNYSYLSKDEEVVAYIRPQQQNLRIGVSKETADHAGLHDWGRERTDGFFGGPSVRWYVPDGDDVAYQQAAQLLATLWRSDSQRLASPEAEASPAGANSK